jgi:hypothetical protein
MAKNNAKMSKESMNALAQHIEEYLGVLLDVFIIPDYLRDQEDTIYESIQTTKKLIKKLREGDTSVFNDDLDDSDFLD